MENACGGCERVGRARSHPKILCGRDAAEIAERFRSLAGLSSETVRCARASICANPVLATIPFRKALATKSQRGVFVEPACLKAGREDFSRATAFGVG